MDQDLREKFDAFYNQAKTKLCPPEFSGVERPLRLARNRGFLLDLVNNLEQSKEFEILFQKTGENFKEKGGTVSEHKMRTGIGNFFRRSRGYMDLFEGISSNNLWDIFRSELEKSTAIRAGYETVLYYPLRRKDGGCAGGLAGDRRAELSQFSDGDIDRARRESPVGEGWIQSGEDAGRTGSGDQEVIKGKAVGLRGNASE